ncbi:PIG-L deacetylase family protein [Pseudonocardia adelaidensis]|uniref:GlcNAc-PI de-N-acetylase n=1 Tax=Pseudonocardia adelaidensis TaxID=648754 RepID=A0ABP9NN80_9PSEU
MSESGSGRRSLLVVSAHAGDFVWRAGGAIALAAERGDRATVVCPTMGEAFVRLYPQVTEELA